MKIKEKNNNNELEDIKITFDNFLLNISCWLDLFINGGFNDEKKNKK